MSTFSVKQEGLSQLQDVLQTPIVMLTPHEDALTFLKVGEMLKTSKHCSVIAVTSSSGGKLRNIKTLHDTMVALKKLRRELASEYSLSNVSLVGIYPSLQYPACVYELHTNADRYVSANILPYDGFAIIGMIKYIVGKFLGTNPSVGGLGLVISRK